MFILRVFFAIIVFNATAEAKNNETKTEVLCTPHNLHALNSLVTSEFTESLRISSVTQKKEYRILYHVRRNTDYLKHALPNRRYVTNKP